MHKTYLDIWFSKGTKHIGLCNYKKAWKEVGNPPLYKIRTNGANRKNGDKVYDFFIHIGYWIFNYTNFDLQCTQR